MGLDQDIAEENAAAAESNLRSGQERRKNPFVHWGDLEKRSYRDRRALLSKPEIDMLLKG